jgi:hypothetical protein
MGYRPGKGGHGLSTGRGGSWAIDCPGPMQDPGAEGEMMPKSKRKHREEALAEAFDLHSLRRRLHQGRGGRD